MRVTPSTSTVCGKDVRWFRQGRLWIFASDAAEAVGHPESLAAFTVKNAWVRGKIEPVTTESRLAKLGFSQAFEYLGYESSPEVKSSDRDELLALVRRIGSDRVVLGELCLIIDEHRARMASGRKSITPGMLGLEKMRPDLLAMDDTRSTWFSTKLLVELAKRHGYVSCVNQLARVGFIERRGKNEFRVICGKGAGNGGNKKR
jgi:hypothetical protein